MNYTITTLEQLRPVLLGFRKSRGLTQAGAAARLGIAQQTYAQLEANPGVVSIERLFKVLRMLGVDLVLADSAHTQPDNAVAPARLSPMANTLGSTSTARPVPAEESRRASADYKPAASKRSGKTSSDDAAQPRVMPKKREVW